MAKFNVGDRVIISPNMDVNEYSFGIIDKINTKDGTAYIGKDWYYMAFLWPERVELQLSQILQTRARLKKEFHDSMSLVLQLKNQITRGEV